MIHQSGVPNFFEKATPRRFVYKRIPVYDASTSAPELEEHSSDIVQFITRGLFHGVYRSSEKEEYPSSFSYCWQLDSHAFVFMAF